MTENDRPNCLRPCVLWFTGLSGAGKSTLATLVAEKLAERNCNYVLLDGDVIRETVSKGLGYSEADRRENIRRLGHLARNAVDAGKVALVAAISPIRDARQSIRASLPAGSFIEVFVDSPIEVCELRDPKGLYSKARSGLIRQFTGIDSLYEPPDAPELHLHTDMTTAEECADRIIRFMAEIRKTFV